MTDEYGVERVVAFNTAVGLQHADVLDRDPSVVDPASDADRSLCEVYRHPIAGARSRGPTCVCMLGGPWLEAGALLVRAWERGAGWPAR